MRVRLQFEKNIHLISEDLRKTWFFFNNSSLKTINDLIFLIKKKFLLKKKILEDIILKLEDFILPPSSEIYILKETDILNVCKKEEKINKKRLKEDSSSSESIYESENEKTSSSNEEKNKQKQKKIKMETQENKKLSKSSSTLFSSSSSSLSSSSSSSEGSTSENDKNLKNKNNIIQKNKNLKDNTIKSPNNTIKSPNNTIKSSNKSSDNQNIKSPTNLDIRFPNQTKLLNNQNNKSPTNLAIKKKDSPILPSKGHFKFSENGDIEILKINDPISEQTKWNQKTPKNISQKRMKSFKKKKNNKKNYMKQNLQESDLQENFSVILKKKKPIKIKPVRDYLSFPLLESTDEPKVGNLLAFVMLELCGGSPELVRKEATVLSYNKDHDLITLKLDEAFLVSNNNENIENENIENENIENDESNDIIEIERKNLSDIRIINRSEQLTENIH
jgi:hypothetical protein